MEELVSKLFYFSIIASSEFLFSFISLLVQSVERSARNHKVPSSIPVLANSAYE